MGGLGTSFETIVFTMFTAQICIFKNCTEVCSPLGLDTKLEFLEVSRPNCEPFDMTGMHNLIISVIILFVLNELYMSSQ